jgi:hypothetical protein
MKTFTVLILNVIVLLLTYYGFASNQNPDKRVGSCGHYNILISYENPEDYLAGCEGIERAKRFFTYFGYTVDIPIHIYFRQQVNVKINGSNADQKQIYGCCNPQNMSIYLTSLSSPFVNDPERVYLGIGFKAATDIVNKQIRQVIEEFHRSFVAHEVTHLFAQHIFNRRFSEASQPYTTMGHGVQEYVASVVQLSTMEPTLLQRILQNYNPNVIFEYEAQINILSYLLNPQDFVIKSFQHFHSQDNSQQQKLLDRILSNELNPDSVF